MSTEINEFQSKLQAQKSLLSRIKRAKRGLPTSSKKLPYGRTFNKENVKWGIDEEKKRNIRWAAEQYLKEAMIPELAKTLAMNDTTLWKILIKDQAIHGHCPSTATN